jgi:hypothetical protein
LAFIVAMAYGPPDQGRAMLVRFADAAEGLQDLARWERQRLELMQLLAVRGHVAPPPDEAFAGWRARLVRVEAGARILKILVPHEAAVRALDPKLAETVEVPAMGATWPS